MQRSLLWKLSAFLIIAILLSSLIQLYFSTRGWRELVEEVEQQASWNVAAEFAMKIQPAVKDSVDPAEVESLLLALTLTNPKVEFLLLDEDGTVLHHIPFREPLHRKRLDMAPIRAALEPKTPPLPLYGDDPFSDRTKKIFSVAPIRIQGRNGFLYMPLMSNSYDFLVRKTGQFYLLKTVLLGIFVSSSVAFLIGYFLSKHLSRRFGALRDAIAAFQRGELQKRAIVNSGDEIGQLSEAFNRMADIISSNMAELRRKDHLRRDAIANISHDLRTPVTSILGYLETMIDYPTTEGEQSRYLTIIHENAVTQKKMVEDLFHFASLEANEQSARKDFVSIERILRSVITTHESAISKKQLTFSHSFSDGLPKVYADAGMLQRVLANIVSNAVRYTPNGGTVDIRAEQHGDKVQCSIADTGIGIPEAQLPFIFDSFYRANQHRPEDPGGTGLGLAIVKKLLALHDSEPLVTSSEDRGTTISFFLPISDS